MAGIPPLNFNPRPPRGGRRAVCPLPPPAEGISIHALREEGDASSGTLRVTLLRFQSTPSARRATTILSDSQPSPSLFQSTPSARRATQVLGAREHAYLFQSTPSARRATELFKLNNQQSDISIHALREESDPKPPNYFIPRQVFQSTPSARRATSYGKSHSQSSGDFNPRPPRGGRRPLSTAILPQHLPFQSTPSARRATHFAT